mgnify:CR=1 FL=1
MMERARGELMPNEVARITDEIRDLMRDLLLIDPDALLRLENVMREIRVERIVELHSERELSH